MSSSYNFPASPNFPLSPSLAAPSTHRGVSQFTQMQMANQMPMTMTMPMMGEQNAGAYFEQPNSLQRNRSLDDGSNLHGVSSPTNYSFDQRPPDTPSASDPFGHQIHAGSNSMPLQMQLLPPQLDTRGISSGSNGVMISPQQAQAVLAAQLLLQQPPPHQPHGISQIAMLRGFSGQSQPWGEPNKDEDPMAILSMSRGNSNLQAALDELDNRTSGGAYGVSPHGGSGGAWNEYDVSADHTSAPSTVYTDAQDADDMVDGAESASPADARQAHQQQQQQQARAQIEAEMQQQQQHPYAQYASPNGYSLSPNVGSHPQAGMPVAAESNGPPAILLDPRFLHSLQSSSSPPATRPGYSRTSSASSIASSSVNNRSGPPSPQPPQRMLQHSPQSAMRQMPNHTLSAPPTMAQQLAAQHASLLTPSNQSAPARRHSGQNTLQVSHLLHPQQQLQQQQQSMPSPHSSSLPPPMQQHRMLGRSPSADSLPRSLPISTPVLMPSASVGSHRPLHLHPNSIQSHMQSTTHLSPQSKVHSLHHSRSHSPQPTHSQLIKLEQPNDRESSSQLHTFRVKLDPASPSPAASASATPPSHSPGFGRSLSHNDAHGYYSDGGGAEYSLPSPRLAPYLAPSAPASAGTSPRGSGAFPNGFSHAFNSRAGGVKKEEGGYADSNTAATLCGPGPIRGAGVGGGSGSGSLGSGDLHRLLLLHAQSGGGGVTTLLPLCPSGSTASSAIPPQHPQPDRIGAYSREERAKRLARYNDKRLRRCWTKRVLYQVRKTFADGRKRVGGRFIKRQNQGCSCDGLCVPECPNYVAAEESTAATAPAATPAAAPSASSAASAPTSHPAAATTAPNTTKPSSSKKKK